MIWSASSEFKQLQLVGVLHKVDGLSVEGWGGADCIKYLNERD